MIARNSVCLWLESQALHAATFCAASLPDSHVDGVSVSLPTTLPAGRATC